MKHYNLVLSANNDIHYAEHSIEVQVPFICYFFPNASIVPVLINDTNETSKQLATVLSEVIEHDSTIKIIASTDLSHYLTQQQGFIQDTDTIRCIQYANADTFHAHLIRDDISMCGAGAVQTLKHVLDSINHTSVLIAHDASPSKTNSVVGYASILFIHTHVSRFGVNDDIVSINDTQKQQLLSLSRYVLMNGVTIKKNINTEINSSHFNLKLGGIFVTLTDMLTDELRGCIGHTYSNNNIYNDIIELTNSAFKNDSRFDNTNINPDTLRITISLLSESWKIKSMDDFIPRKHGLIVRDNYGNSALYLPEVYGQFGLDTKTKFIQSLCKKGNIRKHDTLSLSVFTTTRFSEN